VCSSDLDVNITTSEHGKRNDIQIREHVPIANDGNRR